VVPPGSRRQARSRGEPTPDSAIEVPDGGEDLPRAVPVALRRRWWIVGAFALAALWVALAGWPFDRVEAPTPGPAAASATPVDEPGGVTPTGGSLRRGNEVLTIDRRELAAVDPESGESRTLLDLGTDPLPVAVGGEVVGGRINGAAWSPDGRWVAFDGPGDALWVMDAEMNIRRLAGAVYAGWAWSPTEARLAMVLDTTLTVVDAPTGRPIELSEVIGDVTSIPVWSPDGTLILFGARGGSLFSVNLPDGERSLLARLPGKGLDSMDEIEWSSDGAHIAVMNDLEPGGGRLYVMTADGSRVRILLEDYEPAGLAWSPDGRSLAYAGRIGTRASLWTIPRIESSPSTVLTSTLFEGPVWSPDGGRIGFAASTPEGPRWFAVDPDGTERRRIDRLTYLGWGDGSAFPS
jgi:dipeptidyl aminopeptidase/acylaminoacyl peptidase